jgi:mannose-6-phosphate isomerase-like protein (cupin superfamily)
VLKVTGKDTAGHLAITELAHPQGVPGPPLHIHPNTEEAFYVLAGQLRVRAGEHEHTLSAGGFILVPQGLPHTFTTAGPEPARFLTVHSPAGFEQFLIDVADAERQLGHELGPAELIPSPAARTGRSPDHPCRCDEHAGAPRGCHAKSLAQHPVLRSSCSPGLRLNHATAFG